MAVRFIHSFSNILVKLFPISYKAIAGKNAASVRHIMPSFEKFPCNQYQSQVNLYSGRMSSLRLPIRNMVQQGLKENARADKANMVVVYQIKRLHKK